MAAKTTLEVKGLSVFYGRICAIRDVNLRVRKGEIVGLLGANGAGKSTLMKTVLGIRRGATGTLVFMGRDISRLSTEKIVASGIVYVPEGGGVLPLMTISENLKLGAIHSSDDINSKLEHVFERFPILKERKDRQAKALSGGQRQMVAIGRALMANPKLMMMDEPSLGLAPIVVAEVFTILNDLKESGYSILLSEQNARKALRYADRAYVFRTGSIILQGTGEELLHNPSVREAYLGT